jgi:hypothetical protein
VRLLWRAINAIESIRLVIELEMFGHGSTWMVCARCERPAWRRPHHCEYDVDGRHWSSRIGFRGRTVCEACADDLGLRKMRCPECDPALTIERWVSAVHRFYYTREPGELAK